MKRYKVSVEGHEVDYEEYTVTARSPSEAKKKATRLFEKRGYIYCDFIKADITGSRAVKPRKEK
jgi:hypothetical protein